MRDRAVLALILVLVVGDIFTAWTAPGFLLPAVLYVVPLLLAAYLLSPRLVAVIAGSVAALYLVTAWVQQSPLWSTALRETGLVLVGCLATAFSIKMAREAAQKANSDVLADERNQIAGTLHALVDAMPAGVLISDAAGGISLANPVADELLGGVADGSVYGPRKGHTLHRVDGAPLPSEELPLARAIEKGEVTGDVEILVRRRDGTEKVILASGAPVRNALGYVTGGVAVFQDISRHRLAEEMLQIELQARRELESIVNRGPAVAFLWGATRGWPVEFVSDNVAQFGYTPEDFLSGRVSYTDVVHPEDLERVAAEVSGYTRKGVPEFTQEYRILTKSGEVRWLDDRTWVRRDPNGRVTHYQGIVLDVTERKRVEDEVRRNEARFRRLAETPQSFAFRVEILPTMRFSYISPTAREILGYSPEEWYSDPHLSARVVHPDDFAALRDLANDPVADRTVTFRAVHKRGHIVWVEQRNVSIYDDSGAIVAYEGIVRDVTQRMEAERLREEYVSFISHDLRTPLTVVIGQAALVRRQLLRKGLEEDARGVDAILQSGREMNSMVQDLLETASLESGRMELRKAPTDLHQLVADLPERVATVEQRARIRVECPEPLPPVPIDHARIERAIGNLVINALKFSPTDSPVAVRVGRRDGEALVSVADRGVGIPPEELPYIFERSYRAVTGKKAEGLGLGLYIARLIVEAHGGRIWAESTLREGSTFHLSLPLNTSQ